MDKKNKRKDNYPNPAKQKQLYNDTMNIFKEFARQEEVDDSRQSTVKELICLVQDVESGISIHWITV